MANIIDLTYTIKPGMPLYPGDPEVQFSQVHTIKESGYNLSRITMGSHTGTHMDAPHHSIFTERGVDTLPLDAMLGWAEVLDLGEKPAGSEIIAADLDAFADRVGEGSRVLIKTGWGAHHQEPEYFTNFPSLSDGAAFWLIKRKVSLLGVEQPSLSREHDMDVHKGLLTAGVVLLESVANLDRVHEERVYLAALPLPFAGLDGSPARVVAVEGLTQS
ncbi:MAG: cyclase family protein [Armatimonadota bacterium]|nr:cyclase family protein [bacterium]